jgi:hypothetical protein
MWSQGEIKRERDAWIKVCRLKEGHAVVVFRYDLAWILVLPAARAWLAARILGPNLPLEARKGADIDVADLLQFLLADSLGERYGLVGRERMVKAGARER